MSSANLRCLLVEYSIGLNGFTAIRANIVLGLACITFFIFLLRSTHTPGTDYYRPRYRRDPGETANSLPPPFPRWPENWLTLPPRHRWRHVVRPVTRVRYHYRLIRHPAPCGRWYYYYHRHQYREIWSV